MPLVHSVREKKRSAHYYSKRKPATQAEVASTALTDNDRRSVFCHLTGGGRRVAKVAGSNTRGIYHPPSCSNTVDHGRIQRLSLDEFCKKHGC